MVPPASIPRLIALTVELLVAVTLPEVRSASVFDFSGAIAIDALTVIVPLVESPTRMVPAVIVPSSALVNARVEVVSPARPRSMVFAAVKPVMVVIPVPELIEPVSAALSALIVVGWLPPALLIAAELVNRPFELIEIEPVEPVAVRLAELVTSPP